MLNIKIFAFGVFFAAPIYAGTKACDAIGKIDTSKGSSASICWGIKRGLSTASCNGLIMPSARSICYTVKSGLNEDIASCETYVGSKQISAKRGIGYFAIKENRSLFRYRLCRAVKGFSAAEYDFAYRIKTPQYSTPLDKIDIDIAKDELDFLENGGINSSASDDSFLTANQMLFSLEKGLERGNKNDISRGHNEHPIAYALRVGASTTNIDMVGRNCPPELRAQMKANSLTFVHLQAPKSLLHFAEVVAAPLLPERLPLVDVMQLKRYIAVWKKMAKGCALDRRLKEYTERSVQRLNREAIETIIEGLSGTCQEGAASWIKMFYAKAINKAIEQYFNANFSAIDLYRFEQLLEILEDFDPEMEEDGTQVRMRMLAKWHGRALL